MNRRGFLSTILALGVAPAIVRADSLMRIVPRATTIITHELVDYSEVWRLDQLRYRTGTKIVAAQEALEAQLYRYFGERLDALMADALKDHLLYGVPMEPMKIAKDFYP